MRHVDRAPDLVRVCPRDTDLHKAGRVDLFKLGNCRHLTKQTPGIDPPLCKGAGVPGQLDGPTELGLDAFDKLSDLGCRTLGLFALDADEGGLVLPVEEPDLERPIGKQRRRDQCYEQRDVFYVEAAADRPEWQDLRHSDRCQNRRHRTIRKCTGLRVQRRISSPHGALCLARLDLALTLRGARAPCWRTAGF